jgi:hypothetical protein
MEEARKRAYRVILCAGLLHVKWDLACWYGGSDPQDAIRQGEDARRASLRAFAFHNLAIHAAADFARFSEEMFWRDIGQFQRDSPDALCPYREIFERCLRGDPVNIIAPDGVGGQ